MSAHSHIQRIQMMQQMRLASSVDGGSVVGSYPPGTPSDSFANYQQAPSGPADNVSTYSGVPAGYFPVRSIPPAGSTMGGRSFSKTSLAGGGMSRSLGASKASLASMKSGKSGIAQEYHDRKVHHHLKTAWFGVARTPFLISLLFFFVAILSLTAGLTVTIMRAFGQIFLSVDKGEFIGPLFIALTFAFLGGGFKFLYDAYVLGARQRNNIKFRASSVSMVSINPSKSRPDPGEKLLSGTSTKIAITRTPIGSRNSLSNFD